MRDVQSIDTQAGVNAVKQRFLLLNRERLRRAQESMRERQQDFLDLLPLLLHVNHPILPGFVSKDTPQGVSDFRPSKKALTAAHRIAKSFEFKRKVLPRYDIHALFLMGSSGTIAYSHKSDFDIWVCHRTDLDPQQLAELQQKATQIEEWADSLGLEIHFFLINSDNFKQGRHAALSSESSGTAQHYLLLEEFYRTGLLLAGRYPVWWMVAPESGVDYDAAVRDLVERRFISEHEYVDFGDVSKVPAEEFFGAALWQLFKGIDSPYKSVLKLLLMEMYSSQYPAIDLLCQRFKRAIYAGATDLDQLDPYIMLYRALEEYLSQGDDENRLDFVRRCFYFKVNQRLSAPDHSRTVNWRRELMSSLAETWGWGGVYLEMLDSRPTWKINRVLRERKILVDELTNCYRTLSDFAREHAGLALINQKDITTLGRKLYAAFERKAGKIEIINRGISDDLWEARVSLHQLLGRDNQESWALYRGMVTATDAVHSTPLKRLRGACELVAWSYFNGMVNERTAIVLHTNKGDLSLRELQSMIRSFSRQIPLSQVLETQIDDLERPAVVMSAALFVNVGIDPMRQTSRVDRHIATSRTDALSYSGLSENLAMSFDQVVLTSWKEVLTYRYGGSDGVLNCLTEYLQWAPPSGGVPPPSPLVHCYSSVRGEAIARRIKELFDDVIACFYIESEPTTARYVMAVKDIYYVLFIENDVVRHQRVGEYAELLQYLSQGRPVFSSVLVDRYALADTLLPMIFTLNRPGMLQVVYRVDGNEADVYVVDERGSLFYQRISFFDRMALINQLSVFFAAMLKRQRYDSLIGDADMPSQEIEFYESVRDERGGRKLVRKHYAPAKQARHYFNVQVISDAAEEGAGGISIYCNDVEFTSLEYGSRLFSEVAGFVLKQRRSGQRYPIYITDLDLPRNVLGGEPGGRVQTIHYLHQKRHIEQMLNDALVRSHLDQAANQ